MTALGIAVPAGLAPAAGAPALRQLAQHAAAGDFDGDGKPDVAIGAPGGDRVQVRYTHASPNGSHIAWVVPNAHSVNPMRYGSALAIGDFDGDGFSDLAVGAPDYQPAHQHGGLGNPEPQGAVFVLYGSSTGLHRAPLLIVGRYDGDEPYHLGTYLAAADINADGFADLAASMPLESDGLQVFFGSATGVRLTGEKDLDDGYESSIAFGDVNGDGFGDLIASNDFDPAHPRNAGSVNVWYGRRHGIASTPETVLGSHLGIVGGMGTATAAGDVNHDGFADVVVGNAGDRHSGVTAGSIVVLFGAPHGLTGADSVRFTEQRVYGHARTGDSFGAAVDIGKVTGDRYADIAIGAPGAVVTGRHTAGAVYLLRGSAHGVTLVHSQRFTRATPHLAGAAHTGAFFGAAVRIAQVADGANADLLAGAPGDGGGVAVALLGSDGGLTASHAQVITDHHASDEFGYAVI